MATAIQNTVELYINKIYSIYIYIFASGFFFSTFSFLYFLRFMLLLVSVAHYFVLLKNTPLLQHTSLYSPADVLYGFQILAVQNIDAINTHIQVNVYIDVFISLG